MYLPDSMAFRDEPRCLLHRARRPAYRVLPAEQAHPLLDSLP